MVNHNTNLQIMKTPTIFSTLSLTILLITIYQSRAAPSVHNFLVCLPQDLISKSVHTPNTTSFSSTLQFNIHNLRFKAASTPKPSIIVTPELESQIPALIYCARESGLQIRTRSGGHDFEGLSYVARAPYVVIDLINLGKVTVDAEEKTAWVGSGSTIGSLYYNIYEKSPVLGFPAGICHSVGVGGHFSGGGVGLLLRKYGLSADNVIDARIVDVNGRILNRKSMGEDLFWSIRGGGGASFGVILAWKVQLVDVPEKVTIFRIDRTLEQKATQLVHRWQYVAPVANRDLFLGIDILKRNSKIMATFYALFLGGGTEALLLLMHENFPELGLVREDCKEMSWVESAVNTAGFPINSPPQVLLNRTNLYSSYFKEKSNYVETPIPESVIEGLWLQLQELEVSALIQMSPHGGRMAEISESAIPFPHRTGNLYELLPMVSWREDESRDSEKYIRWVRELNDYLGPYASGGAYLNVRDLDLGVNNVDGETSYEQASVWGKKYFKNNFDRLVRVKTAVDPNNFFRNEQSIPPLHQMCEL